MTNPVFNPEDPRLTAFVLGEIDDTDRTEIEQLLETSPEAQAAVKEIEETIGVLKEGLASEPVPELTAEQRATVEEQLAGDGSSARVMPDADGSVNSVHRTSRAGARFGKLAGVLVSVCALGLLVTVVLPAFQGENGFSVSSRLKVSDDVGDMVAMTAAPEMAESLAVEAEVADRRELFMSGKPAGHLGRDESERSSVADAGRGLTELSSESQPAGTEASRAVRPADFGVPGNRSDVDFAKRDQSLSGLPAPAEKPENLDRSVAAKESKDSNGTPPTSRMIVSSVPQFSESSGPAQVSGGAASLTGHPVAPVASESRSSKNGLQDSKQRLVTSNSSQSEGDSRGGYRVPASGNRAADKSQLLTRRGSASDRKVVDSNVVAGPATAAPQPVRPVTISNPGENQPPPTGGRVLGQSAIGGAPADSAVPGRQVALNPAQNQPEKKVLFYESETTNPTGLKKAMPQTAPASGTVVTQRSREQEEAPGHEARTEKLAELAKDVAENQKQTQLAAVDREATRRVMFRGFGLEGRDLQEQLQQYNDGLSRMRTTLERMPRARTSGIGNEYYEAIVENDFIVPVVGDQEKSLSTISVDVDTASYANMRRFLSRDQLPPANSVRIEELINYFNYNYPEPEGNEPFSVKTELATCPWQPSHRLAMIGLKAKTIEKAQRPPTNLVFLLDVSGSMRSSNKLPLVQQSMRLLVEEMTEDDRISIVTYASNAGVRLQSTLGSKKQEILAAINGLKAGGSTNGEGGIRMAYDEANRHYFQGGVNRVILCSDGDFNVGKSSDAELVELIQEKAASGVFLSVFGFGMGNLKDAKLEKLADKGNGHYGYIDNLNEAKKVFQDELVGTLYTVAKDVKLQVEFNPATVGAYRLIGYENRKLAAQDFTDDTKDAGEIGSGHTVTALYEIIPKQLLLEQPRVDGLKYQTPAEKKAVDDAGTNSDDGAVADTRRRAAQEELMTVKLRYKKPDEEVSQPVQQDFPVKDIPISGKQLSTVSDDLMFAASVASFGMNLRGSKYRGNWGFAEALETAQGAQGDGNDPERTEFIQLVQRAMRITGQQVGPQPRTDEGTSTRPGELDANAARIKASVNGRYRRLVKKIEVREDFQRFGAFNDYGHWDGTEYAGHKDLPTGHWVYVYPNWYIWAEQVVPAAQPEPAEAPTEPRGVQGKPATGKLEAENDDAENADTVKPAVE